MWRNKHRTLITTAALFFAVILSVLTSSLRTGIFDNLIQNMVGFYSGYIQVHRNGYWEERILDNLMMDSKAIQHKISTARYVSGYAPRLESFALISTGENTKGIMVVGIDPKREDEVTQLQKRLISGSYLKWGEKGVGLAKGLAVRLRLNIGDTVYLMGQGYHGTLAAGKFPVKAIFQFGSPDLNERTLFMSLDQAQELYGAVHGITSYAINIIDHSQLNPLASELQNILGKNYEIMTWEQMMPDIKQHISTDTRNMQIIHWILYFLIAFGILGTLLMMMVERSFEMGMLVAIGMRKSLLIIVLMIESVATLSLGCFLGIAASLPIVFYLHKYPIRIGGSSASAFERFGFEAIFPTSIHYSHFTNQEIIVFGLGLLMSLYMIYKVIKLDPIVAMKK